MYCVSSKINLICNFVISLWYVLHAEKCSEIQETSWKHKRFSKMKDAKR